MSIFANGAALLALAIPHAAPAQTPTPQHVREYQRAYHAVVRLDGHRAPGRNIVNWGFAPGKPATDAQVVTSLVVLHRMLAPPPVVASAPSASSTSASTSNASSSSGGWAVPDSVVQCESGGQNLPPNGASASGYYQIIDSTWAANGGTQYAPSAYQATQAQQSTIASKIWAGGSGASQWVCK